MHHRADRVLACGIFLLIFSTAFAKPRPSPEDDHGSMVVTFKDGHRQSFAIAEVARIDLKPPASIVFKDGHRQNVAAPDILRIEVQSSALSVASPWKRRVFGTWVVVE